MDEGTLYTLVTLIFIGMVLYLAVRAIRASDSRRGAGAAHRDAGAAQQASAPAPSRNQAAEVSPQPAGVGVRLGPPRTVRAASRQAPGARPGAAMPAPQRAAVARRAPLRPDPLWVEKGWRRTHNGYQGQFEALGRRWRGEILVPYPGGYEAYIWEPPLQELSDHPHRPCFFARGADRYNVHFRAMPTSVDHAITNIETILREAIQRSQGYANRRVA